MRTGLGVKIASLVTGMVADADGIDDMALLPHGGMGIEEFRHILDILSRLSEVLDSVALRHTKAALPLDS